jgi:hypothetical protein
MLQTTRQSAPVVHHQELQVGHVGDDDLAEAALEHVAVLLVGAVARVGHADRALELAAHAAIDALRPAPAGLDAELAVALVAVKVLALLDLLLAAHQRLHHLCCCVLYIEHLRAMRCWCVEMRRDVCVL